MKQQKLRVGTLILFLVAVMMLVSGCAKKPAPPPPPPPPPATAPTASLSANPETITAGQSTTLTWETTNATDITVDFLGSVPASGSRQVSPTSSITYKLVAKGPGGKQEATTRVTVNQAAAPPPKPVSNETDAELFAQNVKDVYFDYDKADIRPDQQDAIQGDIAFLKAHPNMNFTVEGHCDDRGSTEYNLALGDNRANAVKNALIQGGIAPGRIQTISYGKEKPFCSEETEQCWQENRRGHFAYRR